MEKKMTKMLQERGFGQDWGETGEFLNLDGQPMDQMFERFILCNAANIWGVLADQIMLEQLLLMISQCRFETLAKSKRSAKIDELLVNYATE